MDWFLKMTISGDLCLFRELRLERPREEWELSLLSLNTRKREQ